jgi:hypothetical protein
VVAFTLWNPDPVTVYGFKWGEEYTYWQKLPTAYLPLIGVGIGVVLMCFASLGNWASMRGRLKHCNSQIGKAKTVIDQQRRRIADLEESLANFRRPKVVEEPAAETAPVEEAKPAAESLGDDDEVI